jgi:gamma-glutamyltranspeptidase/glutathione hydrolase
MRSFGLDTGGERPFGGRVFGFRGAVASEHTLSAQAGMDILKHGGNAFDAAAAAVFVEQFVNPHMVTLGGECPMLLYIAAENRIVSVNGNTEAPARATPEAFLDRGLTEVPSQGVLAAGPPAAFAALVDMLFRYGSLPLETILEPAIALAKGGFAVHEGLRSMPGFGLADNRERFHQEWKGSGLVYLHADGSAPSVGERLANAPLAGLLRMLADEAGRGGSPREGYEAARKAFYRGDVAAAIESFVQERDGFLAREDMAGFETFFEEPVSCTFEDATVFKCGPWSQGPVFLQLLRLLEGFDLRSMGHNSADYLHVWVEAAKLAYADREQYYADPRHVNVPMKALLDPGYAAARRKLVNPAKAHGGHRPGDPRGGEALLPADQVFRFDRWGYGTVHVDVVDAAGNMVAATPSGGWISGSEAIPALGFPLTTRPQTFFLDPKHPNVLAPGKRPRTTLSPSLAFRNGRPWMVFGTMGGDQQDQWTSQFFLNRVVFGMGLQEAIEAPKITCDHIPGTFAPHDAHPRRVRLEGRIPPIAAEELQRRGHRAERDGDWSAGFICAVARSEDGLLEAGADPRGAKACVFPACALAW